MADILVIEDDESVRCLVRRILERSGHCVREAENGAVGLKQYRAARADLVMLDMYMPEMDGLETLRELRLLDPVARVVAMSGGGSRNDVQVLRPATLMGATRALLKPFTLQELQGVVDEALRDGQPPPAHTQP